MTRTDANAPGSAENLPKGRQCAAATSLVVGLNPTYTTKRV